MAPKSKELTPDVKKWL